MIEKFLSLFERFVVAVEAIASQAGPLVVPTSNPTPVTEGPKPSRSRAARKEDPQPTPTDNGIDFLGGSAANPPKKYERGDVKAALEKLVAKSGSSTAFSLFQSVGGVQSLNDLPEAKFAPVIEAVEKELQAK